MENKRYNMESSGKRVGMIAAAAVLLAVGVAVSIEINKPAETEYSPVRGFSNMCAYNGQVYAGVNGAYGEPIVQESSIFTIWEDKVYYVEKVQEAYESMTDELLAIKRADRNGENAEVLAQDVFLAGTGYEKLIGDKLFYGYDYDENHRMCYAYMDVNTKERKEITSDRIDNILGYDGSFVYYNGYDMEKDENILGRINLKKDRDETVASYAGVGEKGYIDSVCYVEGKFYCLTLVKEPEGHDYRTYEYRIQVRNGKSGKVEREIGIDFTGSANYSFMVQDGMIYAALQGKIVTIALDSEEWKTVTEMKEDEYWGILHFVPGDGFLYYEAIANVNEETGNNDYFYRVPVDGGDAELLKEWFTL